LRGDIKAVTNVVFNVGLVVVSIRHNGNLKGKAPKCPYSHWKGLRRVTFKEQRYRSFQEGQED
jgi:hypothetical protein